MGLNDALRQNEERTRERDKKLLECDKKLAVASAALEAVTEVLKRRYWEACRIAGFRGTFLEYKAVLMKNKPLKPKK